MSKSKVRMPAGIKSKCNRAIHTAAAAAAAAGISPIPMSDTIPISAAQVAMVVALGKTFDVNLSQSVAKSVMGVTIAQGAGRAIVANVFKCIPGLGSVLGGVISGATAFSLTEALGWLIADDFYRMSKGEEPQDLVENAGELQRLFDGARVGKAK